MDITGLMTTSKAAHFAMSAQSLSKARRHFTGMFPYLTKADILGAIYLAHADNQSQGAQFAANHVTARTFVATVVIGRMTYHFLFCDFLFKAFGVHNHMFRLD